MLSIIVATGSRKNAVGQKERCPGDTRREENREAISYLSHVLPHRLWRARLCGRVIIWM